jgi:hypothetical protein
MEEEQNTKQKWHYKVHGGISSSPEQEASWRQFGRYILNSNLLERNILLIKYPSYRKITWCPRRDISSAFSQMIADLLVTQTLNYGLFKQSNLDEQSLFKKIVLMSKMDLRVDPKLSRITAGDVRERYEILKGELLAGNDSSIIKSEMLFVLDELVRLKKMTEEQKMELLEELNT